MASVVSMRSVGGFEWVRTRLGGEMKDHRKSNVLAQVLDIIRVVVYLELFSGGWSCVEDFVYLLVEAIAHDERVSECQAVRLHGVKFLRGVVEHGNDEERHRATYPEVIRADAFWEVIRDRRS